MLVDEFDYHLPKSAIAQKPLKERDRSRLLIVNRKTHQLEDRYFYQFPEFVNPPDVVVVNNCQVIPARIFAQRKTGAKLEITLLGKVGDKEWECLIKGKKPKAKEEVLAGDDLTITFLEEMDLDPKAGFLGGLWKIRLSDDRPEVLQKLGVPPLPPYIKRRAPEEYTGDRERYQTIFAKEWGAVAAPTAGLHFTERVLNALKEKGVEVVEITLWVSYGTFAPVRVKEIEDHKMYPERFRITKESAEKINQARERGGRVVAVGTTVVRALESSVSGQGNVIAQEEETQLFIYPGYKFKAVDALLTNFHMPKSTLLMLVSAFAGLELIKKAYQYALEKGYRFLSYGDCMLII